MRTESSQGGGVTVTVVHTVGSIQVCVHVCVCVFVLCEVKPTSHGVPSKA